jgi:hypothetical protein
MSAQLNSPALIDSSVDSSFGAYVHKVRSDARDGGSLIELVEQRVAQRQAESRIRLTLVLVTLAALLALLALDLLK